MPTSRSRNCGFGDDEDLMTNGAEISNVSRRAQVWVGANYRIRLRIWRGREERGRHENLDGRRQACQASEEPMHDARIPAFSGVSCSPVKRTTKANSQPPSNQTSASTFTIPLSEFGPRALKRCPFPQPSDCCHRNYASGKPITGLFHPA